MKNSGAGARDITRDYTNGWLTKVREGSTSWGTLTYHPNGMLDTVTHLNGVESRYGLDPQKMQRPASVAAVYGATTYWNSGAYAYDGSGNVKTIGADYFYYDGVQRLVEGTSERVSSSVYKRQRQTYDVYGNITNIATTINGTTWNLGIDVDAATNRLNATNYDPAGNQTSWDGIYTYGYDSLGMMVSQQSGNRDILYFYTADDERVWEYDHNANRSDYTIRDLDKKVLRVFDENHGIWIWKKDMIHRGGAILASASYAGFYHYTVDHLGTPRYISDAARAQIGRHAYYPFGQESTSDTQNQEFAKFTGHERDTNFTGTLDYLDYMHARYYNPMLGRFLSVDRDREQRLGKPQTWNRFAYVSNGPLGAIDPNGLREALVYGKRIDVEPGYVLTLQTTEGNHVSVVAGFDESGAGLPRALIMENVPVTDYGRANFNDLVSHVPAAVDSNSENAGAKLWNKNTVVSVGIVKNTRHDGSFFTPAEVEAAGTIGVRYSNLATGNRGPVCDCSGYANQVVDRLGGTATSQIDNRTVWQRLMRRAPNPQNKTPLDWVREAE